MTTQAWSIMPRIRELDEFLARNPSAHATNRDAAGLRESHPEVCFRRLAEGDVSHSKLEGDGEDERLAILEHHHPGTSDAFRRLESDLIDRFAPHERRFSTDHRDDVVDAMVLALTGLLADGDYQTLPGNPTVDARGIPREIVYVEGARPG